MLSRLLDRARHRDPEDLTLGPANLQKLRRMRDDMEKELEEGLALCKRLNDLEKLVIAVEEAKAEFQRSKENTD